MDEINEKTKSSDEVMETNETSIKNREKLIKNSIFENDSRPFSQPLTSLNLPRAEEGPSQPIQTISSDSDGIYEASKKEFENALSLEEPRGIFQYFKIPGIVVIMVVMGYLIGRFHLSISYLFILVYAFHYLFVRHVHKYKRSLRNEIFKQSMKESTTNNYESVEWINYSVNRFWTVLEPTLSKEILNRINPILADKCPSFLTKLQLSEFTLGNIAPRITGILAYQEIDDDRIQIDTEVTFIPVEIDKNELDYINRKHKFCWNSRIVLSTRIGGNKKGVGVDLPVLVQNATFIGRARIIVELMYEIPLIKTVEFCFLKNPEIDFVLKPLKAVDFMDLPGLSSWIHNTIGAVLGPTLIYPNSIKIDLNQKEEKNIYPIGIVLLYATYFTSKDSGEYRIEIGVDGKREYSTSTKEGSDFSIREYFYFIIDNTDCKINAVLNCSDKDIAKGAISLKKIVEAGDYIDELKFVKNGILEGVLSYEAKFYPINPNAKKERRAIVTMRCIKIKDMQARGDPISKVYSSLCNISISPFPVEEFEFKKAKSTNLVTNSVRFTGKVIGSVTKMVGDVTGINNLLSNETEYLLPTEHTLYDFNTPLIKETNSPTFDSTFRFFSRNLHHDLICVRVIDSDCRILGRVDVVLKEIRNEDTWYKIKGMQHGKILLGFKKEFITDEYEFVEYKKLIRIDIKNIKTINKSNSYSMVVKCGKFTKVVDSFSSGLIPANRQICIPVTNPEDIIFYIFDEKDELIGQSVINRPIKEVPIINDGVDVGCIIVDIEEADLTEAHDETKVVQFKLDKFKFDGPYFVEVFDNGRLVKKSGISERGHINEIFTVVTNSEYLDVRIVNARLGTDECLEYITIDNNSNGNVKFQFCSMKIKSFPAYLGYAELKIISISGLRKPISSYCKIYLNDVRYGKTGVVKKSINPIFNEITPLRVNIRTDTVTISLYEHNTLESNVHTHSVSIPLLNLNEGVVDKFELPMIKSDGSGYDGVTIRVEVKFTKEAIQGAVKEKKGRRKIFT